MQEKTIVIENKWWIAHIDSVGAQLISCINKKSGRQLIWQRDKTYWGRCAPILFPIIGGLKNDCYFFDGKKYEMGKHGFLRDAQFNGKIITQSKASFCYKYNDSTLTHYPFKFEFETTFSLHRYKVIQQFKITNIDNKTMWFCLGAHPAFNLPMQDNLSFNDYMIEFKKREKAPLYYLENDLLAGKKDNFLNNQKQIPLQISLFDNDALIFHRLKSKKLKITPIKQKKNSPFVWVDLKKFPMVGIWTKENGAPFICIEPWYGVDDNKDTDGDFTKKMEVLSLLPNKRFKTAFSFGGR